jgi:hypothetical protein
MASSSRPVARLFRSLIEGFQPPSEALFRREGEFWTVSYAGTTCRLKDVKGLRYIACLLGAPGRDVHALELAAALAGGRPAAETAAPVIDGPAKEAYRQRLHELGEELEQARGWNDPERVARIEAEIDALSGELVRAAGLGGRARRLPSPAERARVSVTKAIRSAIKAIGRHHPALGDHLTASIRTGRLCCYAPPGETPPRWAL